MRCALVHATTRAPRVATCLSETQQSACGQTPDQVARELTSSEAKTSSKTKLQQHFIIVIAVATSNISEGCKVTCHMPHESRMTFPSVTRKQQSRCLKLNKMRQQLFQAHQEDNKHAEPIDN